MKASEAHALANKANEDFKANIAKWVDDILVPIIQRYAEQGKYNVTLDYKSMPDSNIDREILIEKELESRGFKVQNEYHTGRYLRVSWEKP